MLALFRNMFNTFNDIGARLLDSIYHMTLPYLGFAFLGGNVKSLLHMQIMVLTSLQNVNL